LPIAMAMLRNAFDSSKAWSAVILGTLFSLLKGRTEFVDQ
jgi:hypothetical protein